MRGLCMNSFHVLQFSDSQDSKMKAHTTVKTKQYCG